MSRMSIGACAVIVSAASVMAGPLNPPAGPVAPTNKTLEEMEPRTPLVGSTISQPGSYYLTEDHTSTIVISTSGVTLDLNGFTISTGGSDDGIRNSVGLDFRPVTIKNGYIHEATDGIDSTGAFTLVVENVHIADCTGRGIVAGLTANIRGCTVFGCGGAGFEVGRHGVLSDCSAVSCAVGYRIESGSLQNCISMDSNSNGFEFGAIDGTTVRTTSAINCSSTNSVGQGFTSTNPATLTNCTATEGTFQGFFMADGSVLTGCVSQNNGQHGYLSNDSNTFLNCFAIGNGSSGFAPGDASSLTNCLARSNSSSGFSLSDGSSVTGCSAELNGTRGFGGGIGSVLRGCSAVDNGTDGFAPGAGSHLADCNSTSNDEDGFALGSDCRINDCLADGNGGGPTGGAFAGIRATSDCTVDSCTVTDNPTGVLATSGALIIRCTAAGNGTNYSLGTSDHGAVVTPAGSFTETNAFANIEY